MSEVAQEKLMTAYAECRAIAKREAKNFFYAFRVLPKHKADAMCAVYAFMRKADDLADDEMLSIESRRDAMAAWTAAWRLSRTQGSDDPVFIALNDAQRRFNIPDQLLEQLVAGTTLDLQDVQEGMLVQQLKSGQVVHVYTNFAALERYCYLVASVVGLVCIRIFGYSDKKAEQLAIDTGTAFQLTNILRDVKEDAERGRIYLPVDKLAEYGITPERLVELCEGSPLSLKETSMLLGLQGTAQKMYRSSEQLIPLLDKDSRPAMRVLVQIYRRLLDRIAANPAAIFSKRVSVPDVQKIAILGVGTMRAITTRVFG